MHVHNQNFMQKLPICSIKDHVSHNKLKMGLSTSVLTSMELNSEFGGGSNVAGPKLPSNSNGGSKAIGIISLMGGLLIKCWYNMFPIKVFVLIPLQR